MPQLDQFTAAQRLQENYSQRQVHGLPGKTYLEPEEVEQILAWWAAGVLPAGTKITVEVNEEYPGGGAHLSVVPEE